MVLGYGDSISYDQLVQRITGDHIDKSSRFTDWARRPLAPAQLTYAVSDVTHLVQIYEKLKADLEARGRAEWVQEEMKILTSPATYRQLPEEAWQRLKNRARKPKELAVLMELSAWREREAQSRDVPRQRVLKDDAIAELARTQPKNAEALGSLRALPRGFERSKSGEAVLEAIAAGLARDPKTLPKIGHGRASNGDAATVELLKVLLRMTAEKNGVASRVIATVDELEAIAADDDADVPALKGWRRAMFGERALALKAGKLSLAVERGRVVAVER
jgi:ribonuclease D